MQINYEEYLLMLHFLQLNINNLSAEFVLITAGLEYSICVIRFKATEWINNRVKWQHYIILLFFDTKIRLASFPASQEPPARKWWQSGWKWRGEPTGTRRSRPLTGANQLPESTCTVIISSISQLTHRQSHTHTGLQTEKTESTYMPYIPIPTLPDYLLCQ